MQLDSDGGEDDDEDEGEEEGGKVKKYVPPKVMAVHYDGQFIQILLSYLLTMMIGQMSSVGETQEELNCHFWKTTRMMIKIVD